MIVTKKIICPGRTVPPLVLVYPMSLLAEFRLQHYTYHEKGCKNDRTGLVPSLSSLLCITLQKEVGR